MVICLPMTTVLIVEDNKDLANVIRSLLEFENHAVDVFHTGDEGLENILVKPYDLAILDWDLPGVSGLQILRQFRDLGASTPVIMLTGKDGIEYKEAGLDGGADDYITKPFNLKELGARVRAHLRRSTADSKQSVNLADISLDCANQRVTKGARTFVLTPVEFQLLEIAAKYPHLKPSLGDLAKTIWPVESERDEDKLRTALRRLRKKLDPDGSLIFTHLPNEATVAAQPEAGIKTESDSESDPFVSTIFNGKYQILELLGGGGSGLVYKAKHLMLDTTVALKVLHLNISSNSDTARRFQREARLAGLLSHPNIVSVRDFGFSEQGPPYIVMDLIDGTSLAEVLELKGRLPISDVIKIFQQACAGLEHAHSKGMVHRDIKPSNLMIVSGGSTNSIVQIVDFGLARTIEVEKGLPNITQTGDVIGSPPYMSPEQCRGETVDHRSDIYSIGCALFETLQGIPPFVGADPIAILIKHVMEQAPSVIVENVPTQLSNEIKAIVAKCLEKDKQDRYQSASELMKAMTSLPL